jgi:hypothetical protein
MNILRIRATYPAHLILFDHPNNNCIIDEAEVVRIQAKKANRRSQVTVLSTPNVSSRWICVVNLTLRPLYPVTY